MSQTSYDLAPAIGSEGNEVDMSQHRDVVTGHNEDGVTYFGKLVVRETDGLFKHPDSAAKILNSAEGVVLAGLDLESNDDALEPHYLAKKPFSVMKKGRVYVKVTEAVTPASDVYVRFADGVLDDEIVQKGSFGASPDGVAQVATLTPDTANAEQFGLSLYDSEGNLLKAVQVTSDADGTPTEVVTALKAALGSVSGLAFTGTATLIITSSVLGKGFSVEASSTISVVNTTANSQTAAKLSHAKYKSSASAGGLAVLELDIV